MYRHKCAVTVITFLLGISTTASIAAEYMPPLASKDAVLGVAFNGQPVGEKFRQRFTECDLRSTCDGAPLNYGCRGDANRNTVLLKLRNGVIFFDAKMGLDADGSPYSRSTPGATDQPQTSLRYPLPGSPSINADRVPYIVIPLGGFGANLGVDVGDVAAVVYKDRKVFAVVADYGPACKIGEGSIELHERLGHPVCRNRNVSGDCTVLSNVGIEKDVLYFIFPGSKSLIYEGLAPDNIGTRLQATGDMLWSSLLALPTPSNLGVR